MLQVIPESDPAAIKDLAGAVIFYTELHELSPIGHQLTCLGAEVDGVIGVHVWRLGSLKEVEGIIFVTSRCEPFTGSKKSALGPIRDQRTT